MFIHVIPAGALEILLFLTLLGSLLFVVSRVSRRTSYLAALTTPEDLPRLVTASQADVTIRRLFRDREQDVILAEGLFGGQRSYTFCASDFPSRSKIYEASLRRPLTISLFALASLKKDEAASSEPGEMGAIEVPHAVSLTASGPRPNDYHLRGRIVSHRTGDLDGQPVDVYTLQDVGLPIEVAVEAVPNTGSFAHGSSVTGVVRLYGYLPEEPRETVFSAGLSPAA